MSLLLCPPCKVSAYHKSSPKIQRKGGVTPARELLSGCLGLGLVPRLGLRSDGPLRGGLKIREEVLKSALDGPWPTSDGNSCLSLSPLHGVQALSILGHRTCLLCQSEIVLGASREKALRAYELYFPTLRCSGSSKSWDATSSSPHTQGDCTRPYTDGRGL